MVPILNIFSLFNRPFNKLKTLLSATEAISFQLNFLNRIILFFRNLEYCKIEPVWRNPTQIPLHNHQWKKNQNQFSTFLPRSRKTDYKSQSFSLPFLLRTGRMKILSWLLLFEQNVEPATDDGILNWPALFNDRLFVCVHFLKRKKNITNDETKKLINYIYTVLWGLIFQTHPKVSTTDVIWTT